jgi:hypothetical protein
MYILNIYLKIAIRYQKIDGVIDQQVDKSQEERSVLIIDVKFGVFGKLQKSK